MNVALHPLDGSQTILEGLALAGAVVEISPDLSSEDRVTRDADLLVVELGDHPMRRIRELNRIRDDIGLPVLVVVHPDQLPLIEKASGITDFVVEPLNHEELRLRVTRLASGESPDELIVFKDLELNPLTYQAALSGEPLDLTFMEYELLRFLANNPVRVWSRAQLLSKVWGYDYYGGARTVDVHVRRLRSKLGEERASWITTVRSVGYRFG